VCSGAYLGYDIFEKNRLKNAFINDKKVSHQEAIEKVAKLIDDNPKEVALIANPFSTNETLEEIKK